MGKDCSLMKKVRVFAPQKVLVCHFLLFEFASPKLGGKMNEPQF